jgi:hypothetical protein
MNSGRTIEEGKNRREQDVEENELTNEENITESLEKRQRVSR